MTQSTPAHACMNHSSKNFTLKHYDINVLWNEGFVTKHNEPFCADLLAFHTGCTSFMKLENINIYVCKHIPF